MKVIFLDFDGVINSHQSAHFWHNRRDQSKWENEMYKDWPGTLKEYIAQEFCPIALSNVEELIRRVPELKVVVSSTWRLGETVESLQKILHPAKLVADAVIGVTPRFPGKERGEEIQAWLDEHPEVTNFVILDDDADMVHLKHKLVQTNSRNGFTYTDMERTIELLNKNWEKCPECQGDMVPLLWEQDACSKCGYQEPCL